MIKSLFSRVATGLAVGVIALAAIAAEAQVIGELYPGGPRHPGAPGQPGRPGRPGYPGRPGGMSEDVTMTVGRQYQGFTRLDISQLMAIATQGRSIESLTVTMWAPGGRSQATLLENGRPTGATQFVGGYASSYYFGVQFPGARSLLELQINGPVYIETVTARVIGSGHQPPGWPQQPVVLTEWVNQTFRGGGYLDLYSVVDLYRHQGMRVTRVLMRGTSARGLGQAELQVNRVPQGQVTVGTWSQEYSFYPYGMARLGYEIQNLDFVFRGNITVESVTVELQP
ncbi:MAG: collagen-like protein [Bdellovibrionaceae bacterium]|nr:collagen-like protein [Pseudobdellovibrionaceae bacterium]